MMPSLAAGLAAANPLRRKGDEAAKPEKPNAKLFSLQSTLA